MPEHTIPDSLIRDIRSGRAALVVGAGIGLATWKKLLEQMNEELRGRGRPEDEAAARDVDKLLHKGSLVRAAGFLGRTLGEDTCDRVVHAAWSAAGELPQVARALARLPFRQVWTTFPGDALERAMVAELREGWPEPRVFTYQEVGDIDRRRRTLLKVLGDFGSYVVTPKSIRKALSRADELREHVREDYATGTLVLVGFRYGDPDLAALLDRVFGAFEPPESVHYMVASGVGPVTVEELASEHHIEVINLEGKGADERATAALLDYLESLRLACEEAGLTLAQTRPDEDDIEGWVAVVAEDPSDEEARAALASIEQRARDSGDADRLVEVLMGRIEVEANAGERAALLRQVAEVFETQVGDLPRAFTALTAALREDPADTSAVDAAERLADDADGWSELVGDVAEVAPTIEDAALAAAYFARLGRWYHRKLSHDDYAIASLRQALKLDAKCTRAYEGLAEVYRVQQRWAELADALAAHLEVETADASRVDLNLALGDLQESQLASTSRAIAAYQAAADIDPACDDALVALERLYRREERWGKLAKVLERRAELFEAAGESGRAGVARQELATLRAEKLGDIEGAIAKYEAVLAKDEANVEALRALEDLYDKAGRTDKYLTVLERLARVVPEGERAGMLRRFAVEVEDREGGRARAIDCYLEVVSLEPGAEDAYRALERLCPAEARWDELVSVYERHIATQKAPAPRADLYTEMGQVLERELSDKGRAIEAYKNALEAVADHAGALDAIARLYEETGAFAEAVSAQVALAELEGPGGADRWARAGTLAAEQLGDLEVAEHHLEKALEVDSTHVGALLGLADLHGRRGAYANEIARLTEAAEHSANRLERIRLLLRAAETAEEKLEDSERGLKLLHNVLEIDPEHQEAGRRAADRLVAAERWEEAVPLLEMLARHTGDGDQEEKVRRALALAGAYREVGQPEKAGRHYRIAFEANPADLDAALGLTGAVLDEASEQGGEESWRELSQLCRQILARHGAALADEQAAECWYRVGLASRALEEPGKAEDAFRRAVERDARHQPALDQLIEVAGARGDWDTAVQAMRDRLVGADDEREAELLEQIGDIYVGKLKNPIAALEAYREALEHRPDSHVIMHKMLDVYSEQKQWKQAVETLESIAGTTKDAARRAKYYYAAAVIGRDELAQPDIAIDFFQKALEHDPTTPKALDAVEKLLEARGAYKDLARTYRKMLKRLGEDGPHDLLLKTWSRLGDVCAEHLGDQESAIAAYEVAASLDPEDMKRHEQLADLYLEGGKERRADAVEELQLLVRHQPDRVELYRALSELYRDEGELDKAYCLAQALVFLGAADDQERALFEQLRPRGFTPAKRRLTAELWQRAVTHDLEDRHIDAIFSSLVGSIAATTAQPPSAFNLSGKSPVDFETDPHPVSRVFKYAIDVLGLDPAPRLVVVENGEGMKVANTAEKGKLAPTVLVGNPQAKKSNERELAFEVGKRLAYFRPERFVTYALQTLPKLESAFYGALSAAGVAGAPEADGEAARLATHIRKTVPSAVLEQVGSVAGKMKIGEKNGVVAGWRTATDLTANRVGLILCNDLEVAAKMVATEAGGVSALPAKERLRDLLAYSVSETYFQIRRHMGLAVQG